MAAILSQPQFLNRNDKLSIGININEILPGGHLNTKMSSCQYRDTHVKDKMYHDCFFLNMVISIPGKDSLYIEMGPWWPDTFSNLCLRHVTCGDLLETGGNGLHWRIQAPEIWALIQYKDAILTCIGNPIVETRRSWDRLISTMGCPILVRRHLYRSLYWNGAQASRCQICCGAAINTVEHQIQPGYLQPSNLFRLGCLLQAWILQQVASCRIVDHLAGCQGIRINRNKLHWI